MRRSVRLGVCPSQCLDDYLGQSFDNVQAIALGIALAFHFTLLTLTESEREGGSQLELGKQKLSALGIGVDSAHPITLGVALMMFRPLL